MCGEGTCVRRLGEVLGLWMMDGDWLVVGRWATVGGWIGRDGCKQDGGRDCVLR